MDDVWEFLPPDEAAIDDSPTAVRADPPAEIAAMHVITLGGQLAVQDGGRNRSVRATDDVEEDVQTLLERQHYACPPM
jgi:hypothetical protein